MGAIQWTLNEQNKNVSRGISKLVVACVLGSRRPGKDEQADGDADASDLSRQDASLRLDIVLGLCRTRLVHKVQPKKVRDDRDDGSDEYSKEGD
jgi:hypothetical protein